MNLDNFFQSSEIVQDGYFETLGGVRTNAPLTLGYANTISHLRKLSRIDNISCLIIENRLEKELNSLEIQDKGLVSVQGARNVFYNLHEKFIIEGLYKSTFTPEIEKTSQIHETAVVSDKSYIGKNVIIGERAVVCDNVYIDSNVIVEPGAIIGCDGILYKMEDNKNYFIKHAGEVFINQYAVIMSNAVVVKSIHPSIKTEIGERSIIGIASTIGHEAYVGNDCVISGNSVVARNAILNDNSYIGTNVVIRENTDIGKNAKVFAGSTVISNVLPDEKVSGNFSYSHHKRLIEHSKKLRD